MLTSTNAGETRCNCSPHFYDEQDHGRIQPHDALGPMSLHSRRSVHRWIARHSCRRIAGANGTERIHRKKVRMTSSAAEWCRNHIARDIRWSLSAALRISYLGSLVIGCAAIFLLKQMLHTMVVVSRARTALCRSGVALLPRVRVE